MEKKEIKINPVGSIPLMTIQERADWGVKWQREWMEASNKMGVKIKNATLSEEEYNYVTDPLGLKGKDSKLTLKPSNG